MILMLRFFIISLFGLSSLSYAEQQALLIDSSFEVREVSLKTWYYEDRSAQENLDQIRSQEIAAKFASSSKKTANYGFSNSSWWGRTALVNDSGENISLVLTQSYINVDAIEFFLVHETEGVLAQKLTGDRMPMAEGAERYRLPFFDVNLPPGKSWIYSRVKSEGAIVFQLKLHSAASFSQQTRMEYSLISGMICALFAIAAYNFFTWLQLRTMTFFSYVGFILAMAFQVISYSGMASYFARDPSFLLNEGYLYFGNLTNITACYFTILFLSLRSHHRWLFWLILSVLISSAMTMLLVESSYNTAAKLSVLNATLTSLSILLSGIVCSFSRYRPAYFFTLAWLFVSVASIARMAMVSAIIHPNFFSEWGGLIGTVVEAILLSLALADKVRLTEKHAFERIAELNKDLRTEHEKVIELNTNLENMVEEQTREIKSIMKHIQLGIVMVKDERLTLTETYSEAMKSLYRMDMVAGRNLLEMLWKDAQINEEMRSQAEQVLLGSLGEDALNFEMNIHLLPRELSYKDPHSSQIRVYQIDWNPVVREGMVEKMLVTIKDVTTLKQLEASASEKSKMMSLIEELLDNTSKQIGVFMSSAQKFMSENLRLIQANPTRNHDVLKVLMMNLHTCKGAARALGLKTLTPIIHETEQYYASIMHLQVDWNYHEILLAHERVSQMLQLYSEINHGKLGRGTADMIVMSLDLAERLRQTLEKLEPSVHQDLRNEIIPIRRFIEDQSYIPAGVVLREVLGNAEVLARDLQKEPPLITIHDNNIKLSSSAQELVRNIFVHIIRNSMDHGLESAEEREAKGKAPTGRILVEARSEQAKMVIHYEDDGRGLNLRAIHSLGVRKGLLKPDQNVSPEDLAELIFASDFSTSATVSDISGRGVGMNAVREYTMKHGGRLRLILLKDGWDSQSDFIPFYFRF